MNKKDVKISKFISLVLRHRPKRIGLTLDPQGWADVDEFLRKCGEHHMDISMQDLERVVANNDKKRFAFNEDKTNIRASQGHSIDVDLGYTPKEPPEELFHGTADRNLDSIKKQGLVKRKRQHVHLSPDRDTAVKVGVRHGKPVVLIIRSGEMQREGHQFFLSQNGVWLTEHIPPAFIDFP